MENNNKTSAGLGMITNAANTALGQVFGLAFGGINDRRQLRQQQKLQDQQIAGQKEMAEFNRQQAMQMWKDTNFSAQKEEMVKAGINPATMLGMSGGGGTTANVPTGSVSGSSADGGAERTVS